MDIIDTFPDFLSWWESVRCEPVDVQIDRWASDYMAPWPELLDMQRQSYADEGVNWRDIARERVFPMLEERLSAMSEARKNLAGTCPSVARKAAEALGFEADLVVVIYVGIGCGAGWAASYAGKPALLLGLEMIAECGWQAADTLEGLLAHEIGHHARSRWRREAGARAFCDPWGTLHSEGFAQRCEHVILGRETWHESVGINGPDWLEWCRENTSWLAGEFLRLVGAGESVRPFFGSWYDLQGRKQCGYYLGHELIGRLQCEHALRDIAIMDDAEARLRTELLRMRGAS